jgi:hypothetical protein
MLIPEDRIRAAILNPIGAVRSHALKFWRGEHRMDPSVRSLVRALGRVMHV